MKLYNALMLFAAVVPLLIGLEAFSSSWDDLADIWIAIVVWLVVVGLIRLVLPDSYEVWPDHLRIAFPFGSWRIPFDTVDAAVEARWWEPYGGFAVRLATAPGQSIVIRRRNANLLRRPNIVISPHERVSFLPCLQSAIERSRVE